MHIPILHSSTSFSTPATETICVQLAYVFSIVVEHLALIDKTGTGAASEGGAIRGGADGGAPPEAANCDGNGDSIALAAGTGGEAVYVEL